MVAIVVVAVSLNLNDGCPFFVPLCNFAGVPSQPSNFRATDIGETAVTLQWSRPTHSGENIVHYELYWNDTYANEQHHQYVLMLFYGAFTSGKHIQAMPSQLKPVKSWARQSVGRGLVSSGKLLHGTIKMFTL